MNKKNLIYLAILSLVLISLSQLVKIDVKVVTKNDLVRCDAASSIACINADGKEYKIPPLPPEAIKVV